jgi:hypothetical protein
VAYIRGLERGKWGGEKGMCVCVLVIPRVLVASWGGQSGQPTHASHHLIEKIAHTNKPSTQSIYPDPFYKRSFIGNVCRKEPIERVLPSPCVSRSSC